MTGRQVRVVIVAVAVVILGSAIAAAVVPAAARRSVAFGGAPSRTGLDDRWSIPDSSAAAGTMRVTVTNDSDDVAFFVRLRLTAGMNGSDVTPVTWSDGYVTLMPGEEQTLTASYRTVDRTVCSRRSR